jgi:NADH-quinone oxidoreductase subunit M
MFSQSPRAAVLAATGMILGAAYLLLMLKKVLFGPLVEPSDHSHSHGLETASSTSSEGSLGGLHAAEPIRPVGWHEIAGLTPLMVLIVLIGVFPGYFLDRIQPSVAAINQTLQAQREGKKAAPVVTQKSDTTPTPAGDRFASVPSRSMKQEGR